jgi:hypothetical protein
MDKSIRTPLCRLRSGRDAIPYTKYALERDLERVQDAWDDSQADRRRHAIYGYLKAVYDLVNWWSAVPRALARGTFCRCHDAFITGRLPPRRSSMSDQACIWTLRS